jgi:hypothetical protein
MYTVRQVTGAAGLMTSSQRFCCRVDDRAFLLGPPFWQQPSMLVVAPFFSDDRPPFAQGS